MSDRRTARKSIVAVISTPPPITGQATAGRILTNALAAQRIEHHVVSTASSIDDQTSSARKALRSVRQAARLARLRPSTPTVLYLQLGQGPSSIIRDTAFLTVAATRRWSVVGHVHGGGWRTGLDATPAPVRSTYLRLLKRAEVLIALTPRLTAMFDGVFDGETGGASTGPRIEVIGNSVEEDLATRALAGGASWSAEPTVAFVSNLMPEKGVDVVIEAARLAHDQGRAFRFVLAGHDPHGRATSLPPNARWAGVVADDAKFELLASAQVFVLPTSYRVEGEPISILEALHVGLPVVSSDQGGVADIVDETNGRLINPIDAEALLDAIDALTSDRSRWEAMSANNRRQAAECHSPNRHLEQLFATLGFQNPT